MNCIDRCSDTEQLCKLGKYFIARLHFRISGNEQSMVSRTAYNFRLKS